jgi:hypothetical protein
MVLQIDHSSEVPSVCTIHYLSDCFALLGAIIQKDKEGRHILTCFVDDWLLDVDRTRSAHALHVGHC